MKILSFTAKMIVLAILLLATNIQAVEVEKEELVQASMIEKISRFIEWPSWKDKHFSLCVLEKSKLLPAIQSYYETGILQEKPVILRVFKFPFLPKKCQAVFVGDEKNEFITEIIKLLRNNPVLVITETKNAVDLGVHVDFYYEDNRLHLEVNSKSLKSSGFKVSFHLLKVARIVE